MSKRPHLLATVVVQHRLIKHRNLPDEPLRACLQIDRGVERSPGIPRTPGLEPIPVRYAASG